MIKSLALKAILICVSTLALGELILRTGILWNAPTPDEIRQISVAYGPSIFSRHVLSPGPRWSNARPPSNYRYFINSLGYRGAEFSEKKSEGTLRLLIYGGSAAFDAGMEEGQDWPHAVGTILNNQRGMRVESINAAVPGHASFDNLGTFYSEGQRFQSDYVYLYNAWNDIKYFSSDKSLLRSMAPFDPHSNMYQFPANWADALLSRHLRLYSLARFAWITRSVEFGFEGKISQSPLTNKISENALRQFRINVETFVAAVRSSGAKPIIITEAHLAMPDNEQSLHQRINYSFVGLNHGALCNAYSQIELTLLEISKRHHVPLIDASAELSGRPEYFDDHVHLSPLGSKRLANIVATYMLEHEIKGLQLQ